MYKIFIRRWLSFAVGYPSPWVILRHGLSFAVGYPSPLVILRRWLSFAVGYPSPLAYYGHIQSRIIEKDFQRGGQSSSKNGIAKYAVKSNYQ